MHFKAKQGTCHVLTDPENVSEGNRRGMMGKMVVLDRAQAPADDIPDQGHR